MKIADSKSPKSIQTYSSTNSEPTILTDWLLHPEQKSPAGMLTCYEVHSVQRPAKRAFTQSASKQKGTCACYLLLQGTKLGRHYVPVLRLNRPGCKTKKHIEIIHPSEVPWEKSEQERGSMLVLKAWHPLQLNIRNLVTPCSRAKASCGSCFFLSG